MNEATRLSGRNSQISPGHKLKAGCAPLAQHEAYEC